MSDIEKDVSSMLVAIGMGLNVDSIRIITKNLNKYGVEPILNNLKSRSQTPLILWVIDYIKS
jgi:hypothetical protein